jgi:aromatic ring-cleaving dioxygenase
MMIFINFFTLFACIFSHSIRYTDQRRNQTCWDPVPKEILHYHVHLFYHQASMVNTEGARRIRDKFIEVFRDKLGPPCNSSFHINYLCMFEDIDKPDGPFITAQWAVFLPIANFHEVTSWFLQNREDYDVLIHPNTGCEIEDHSWWALWAGNKMDINYDAFSYDYPFPWTQEMIEIADPILQVSDDIMITGNRNVFNTKEALDDLEKNKAKKEEI